MATGFLVMPLMAFGQRFLGLPLPSVGFEALLANNLLFLLWLCVRLVGVYLVRMPRTIRYGSSKLVMPKAVQAPVGNAVAQEKLKAKGYVFDRSGAYGERRDRGYWGALLVHAGLVFTLVFGTYDNLVQFSGTIYLGVGQPVNLSDTHYYASVVDSKYTSLQEIRMKLGIKNQILPSEEWPGGASEIFLLTDEGEEIKKGIVAPGRPMKIPGNLEVHTERFVYDAWVAILRTKGNLITFTDWIRLLPLREKAGNYTHYGTFPEMLFPEVKGEAWYDPYDRKLKVMASKENSTIANVVLAVGGEFEKEHEGYTVRLNGVGQWSELHIVRPRHKNFLPAGGIAALFGFFIRLAFGQKRVWLEDRDGETLVRATDREVSRLLEI